MNSNIKKLSKWVQPTTISGFPKSFPNRIQEKQIARGEYLLNRLETETKKPGNNIREPEKIMFDVYKSDDEFRKKYNANFRNGGTAMSLSHNDLVNHIYSYQPGDWFKEKSRGKRK